MDFRFPLFSPSRLLFAIIVLIGCEKDNLSTTPKDILAKVGDRFITSKDFLQRAEYTIRPEYCKGNYYIHKKIILNNLIAEKLLALEIESSNMNTINEGAAAFIKGRKEQSMRQLLYYKQGYQKSKVDKSEINHYYKMAGRTYDISHFSFPGGAFLDSVQSALKDSISFEDIYRASFDEKIPKREVKWEEPNNAIINQALFNSPVKKNDIVGPFKLEDGSFFMMKVNGWTDRMAMTDKAISERNTKVINTLRERKGLKEYESFVSEVMKGKEIKFNQDVFLSYANAISERFFRSRREKESAISSALFNSEEFLTVDDIQPLSDEFSTLILFEVNNIEWTIQQFEKDLLSHPLVFRKKKMNKNEFSNQFRLAIVDFIQDKFLTEKAYAMSLDRSFEVLQSEQVWKDSFLAYQSSRLYDQNTTNKDRHIKMKPIIDKLQEKYSKDIYINTDLFEKIKVSNVDMFVTQSNVPYPVMVPNFPSYTDDSYLDYGAKLD